MNKADIISKVHEVLGSTKADAERAVDAVFGSIEEAMKDGTAVSDTAVPSFIASSILPNTASTARSASALVEPSTSCTLLIISTLFIELETYSLRMINLS